VNLNSNLAEPNSVDAVVTFRNLHNWLGPEMDSIFENSFKALRSGGSFGVVEHRANSGTDLETMKKSGYVTEDHAIKVALKHGFELVAKSEINANPKDTKDHPKGVWTLPPRLRLNDVDRDKYESIGESDRMTLLFRKP
jgi:predicted methyltransferase